MADKTPETEEAKKIAAATSAAASTKPAESSAPIEMLRGENDALTFRYFRAGKEDFEDDNTFQVKMSSEFPAEQRANKEHERLGIAKVGEKYVEVLSHAEGDVDLTRFNGENRAALLDEHIDGRHLGYIKTAALSKDKSTRGVPVFDNLTKLSKTRCEQVRTGSRPNFSIGYSQTRYLGTRSLDDGRTGHVFAWKALELSNVAVPADPTAQKGRSKNQECHCIRCGDIYGRKELNDDFICPDCSDAESPAESDERKAQHGERTFRAKAKDGKDVRISHNDLRNKVSTALDSDKRFKFKHQNGDLRSDFYIMDIHLVSDDANKFQAIVQSPAWRDGSKLLAVDFTYDDEAVTLGDHTEVAPKTTLEAVDRGIPFDAKTFRAVDSQKLSTAEQSATTAQNQIQRNFMAKTLAELKTEAPELVTAIEAETRSATEKNVRAAVVTEAEARSKKREPLVKEIRALRDEFIKDHGLKWAGKPGEVVVVGTEVRKFSEDALELASKDDTRSDSEIRSDFKNKANELIRGARAPKNQEEAATLPDELASRCSMRRIYNEAANAQARGERTTAFRLTTGAEFEADTELRKNAREFPAGTMEMAGMSLPYNMRSHKLNLSRKQMDRMTRDSLAGDFISAGALIAPEFKFPTIELLRNKMALGRARITILGGVIGNLVLPRQTSPTTSQSLAEGAALAEYDQTFDQITMTPHRIGSMQKYSRLALLQTTEDFEALVMNDHMAQNALNADAMVLNGSGANNQPLGLLNQVGIGVVTFAGSASSAYKNCITLETLIRQANIDEEPTYITTSKARGTLRITPATLTGSTVVSGQSTALWVGDELVGRPAVDSQQVPGDILVCLVGRHVVMAQWGGWQVVLDTLTLADQDKIKLSVNTYIDAAVRHPQAISRSADSIASLT